MEIGPVKDRPEETDLPLWHWQAGKRFWLDLSPEADPALNATWRETAWAAFPELTAGASSDEFRPKHVNITTTDTQWRTHPAHPNVPLQSTCNKKIPLILNLLIKCAETYIGIFHQNHFRSKSLFGIPYWSMTFHLQSFLLPYFHTFPSEMRIWIRKVVGVAFIFQCDLIGCVKTAFAFRNVTGSRLLNGRS